MNSTALSNESHNRSKIHPKKFALYVAGASIVMMFAAFTSAYVVRQAAGNWYEFNLPEIFYYNTFVILLASVALQFSFQAFKKGQERMYKNWLILGFVLALAFLYLQYQGWLELYRLGIPIDGNPSGSFIYIISGVHAAHVVGGVVALILALMHAFALPYKVTETRKLRFDLTVTYWHFVDLLWVYLVLFFILSR